MHSPCTLIFTEIFTINTQLCDSVCTGNSINEIIPFYHPCSLVLYYLYCKSLLCSDEFSTDKLDLDNEMGVLSRT